MDSDLQPGVYGKLPSHGDFIHRNLPSGFISSWDEWLQLFVGGSKEYMGDAWLDIYLTSPIWRFVLSAGVIDENHWAGILLPSVDQVGRYYPFSIVMPLSPEHNPLDFISAQTDWFNGIEELALNALDEQCELDDITDAVKQLDIAIMSSYKKTGQRMESNALQIDMEFEEQLPLSVYPYLLDSILSKSLSSYSVWTTQGSERIAPCLFTVQGLPSTNNIPAMMDGQWSYWGWPKTYTIV